MKKITSKKHNLLKSFEEEVIDELVLIDSVKGPGLSEEEEAPVWGEPLLRNLLPKDAPS